MERVVREIGALNGILEHPNGIVERRRVPQRNVVVFAHAVANAAKTGGDGTKAAEIDSHIRLLSTLD